MGYASYSVQSRMVRAVDANFHTNSINENFKQNALRKIHESMDPKGITFREARDSVAHPNSIPIMLALDVTGSMGVIPQYMVKDGLPHLMGTIIERGIPDPQLLFMAIGDTSCDSYPLQVGQFESGDAELDTWLTRTYIEGGGGGNEGESYLLAWYVAAFHTLTDAWEKRKQKGFLFTTGDEPCLKTLPKNILAELIGHTPQAGYTAEELLEEARKTWNVYHLHITQTSAGSRSLGYWRELLGDYCIPVGDYKNIGKLIASIVTAQIPSVDPITPAAPATPGTGEIIL